MVMRSSKCHNAAAPPWVSEAAFHLHLRILLTMTFISAEPLLMRIPPHILPPPPFIGGYLDLSRSSQFNEAQASPTSQRSGAAGSHGQSRSAQITLEPSSFNTSHSPSPHGPCKSWLMIPITITTICWTPTWLRSAWQERSSGHQTWRCLVVGNLRKS